MNILKTIANITPLRRLLMHAARRHAVRFLKKEPLKAQRRIFTSLVKSAAATRFGQDHNFRDLTRMPFDKAYAVFCKQVPIRTYADFWDDYFKCHQQELADGKKSLHLHNTTWPGLIHMFCETSGTTAPTKFIPFSRVMFKQNRQAAQDLISCYLNQHPESQILAGKILYMSGPTTLTEMETGVYSGDMSAITLRFRPWYLEPFVEPPASISALPWEDKLEAMAKLLLQDSSIRTISGVPPWIIMLLKRCRDISARPVKEILPHLELIIHGGTSIKPYLGEFRQLFGGQMPEMIELLPSSEAFMGFQCAGDSGMRLTPYYGVFFEFVRFEDLEADGKPAPFAPAVPLEKVQPGQRYAVILSTCAGLWRYHIGDTIRFTSLSPHLMDFTGRDRFLDKLEEKVTQEEIERAVAGLNSSGSLKIREFVVGTDVANRRHIWVLARDGQAGISVEQTAAALDSQLREMNADYDAFRGQGRIDAPEILFVPGDMIYEWSKDVRGKLGGQSKIPHIDPTHDSSMIFSLKNYAGAFATR